MNRHWRMCETILTEFRPVPSRARFVRSVQRWIEKNPDVFPTAAQEIILGKIFRTLEKEHLTDVEKQAREYLGLDT